MSRLAVIVALSIASSTAHAEPSRARIEVAAAATISFGISDAFAPMGGPGLGLRAVLPSSRSPSDLEIAVEASRLSGAALDGFDYTRVEQDRWDRLRFTVGGRFHRAASRGEQHSFARLGIGVDVARSTVTTSYDDIGGTSTDTERGTGSAVLATAGYGLFLPGRRVAATLELELAVGIGRGEPVNIAHQPAGPLVELRLVVSLGGDVW